MGFQGVFSTNRSSTSGGAVMTTSISPDRGYPSLTRRSSDLKRRRPPRFVLNDDRALSDVVTMNDVTQPQLHQVAAFELCIQRDLKHGQIPYRSVGLEMMPDAQMYLGLSGAFAPTIQPTFQAVRRGRKRSSEDAPDAITRRSKPESATNGRRRATTTGILAGLESTCRACDGSEITRRRTYRLTRFQKPPCRRSRLL